MHNNCGLYHITPVSIQSTVERFLISVPTVNWVRLRKKSFLPSIFSLLVRKWHHCQKLIGRVKLTIWICVCALQKNSFTNENLQLEKKGLYWERTDSMQRNVSFTHWKYRLRGCDLLAIHSSIYTSFMLRRGLTWIHGLSKSCSGLRIIECRNSSMLEWGPGSLQTGSITLTAPNLFVMVSPDRIPPGYL